MTRAPHAATVLVSGAAAGIGLSVTRLLGAAGSAVVGLDVAPPPASMSSAASAGVAPRFVVGDVRRPQSWRQAVSAAEAWTGGIDAVILNAGVASARALTEADPAEIERVLDIDLLGVILGVRAVVPALRRRGGGAIVATSSLAGLIPYAPDPVYAAAKHGVIGLVRSIAATLAADQITINAVCPGLTDTAILPARVRAAAAREDFPLIAADDIAAAVLDCVRGTATGQALVCQAGRPPVPYRFRQVPGPAGGIRAPVLAPEVDG